MRLAATARRPELTSRTGMAAEAEEDAEETDAEAEADLDAEAEPEADEAGDFAWLVADDLSGISPELDLCGA